MIQEKTPISPAAAPKKHRRSFAFSSLRMRLTATMCLVVLTSILTAWGLSALLTAFVPAASALPETVQVCLFGLCIALVASILLGKIFFEPIRELQAGMHKVAGGDFDVIIETSSNSVEVKEMFAAFNLMTRELRATEILQTDFVSNVSHEFKTPINAIEGYATLLQSSEHIGDTERAYIEKLLFNTRRLSSLVSNILLLSKIENQSIHTNRTRFSVDEQIRQSILALEPQWEKKGLEFDVDLEPVFYVGSENLMLHVWNNIIGNAVKFSPDGGGIRLRLCRMGGCILFTCEDSGPGLSEEAQKHLFDKFYQADSSHEAEGNGLGLALVKRILSISGGEISAENRSQGGCRFTVTLRDAEK